MKKIISLVLAVCLIATMFCCVTMTASAATTVSDITVDLSKVYRIGTDEGKGITLTTTNSDDGSVNVAFSNYKVQLFNSDGSIPTAQIWINGGILALKNSNDEFIVLQAGTKYSINVIYDVTSVATSDTTYQPQIGLVRNNHSSNTASDNGTVIYTAKKHSATGSYSLSYQTTPTGNQPLRLAFGGHGAITIKSITIKAVTHSFDEAKALDLTNVEPISVNNASYSNFTPATASTPMSLDVNATYAYNGTLFDGTNTWLNTWTVMYLKTLVPLKYDADNYMVLNSAKTYKVSVTYKVTATTATEIKDYPEIGIVRNNGYTLTQDNGSKVIAAQRIAPADVGVEKTLTTTIDASSLNGYALRLAFTGKGSFEVSSVTIQEYTNAVAVTCVNDGITTVDYGVYGAELPTPVKDGYTFKGWFDANGVKHTNITGAVTVTAAWIKTGNVDLTASDMISGSKATMTLNIPTDADSALGVTIQGFQGILMNKEDVVHTGTVYTGGAAVSLEYSNEDYVGLDKNSKYVVNVEYDVTNIGTYDKGFHPQIAILYNANTLTEDNGQIILAAKKHSETVDNASISCVVSGVTAKALRLGFDGQGTFNIKSVTVTEMGADTVGLNTVKYTDSTYSTDTTVLAENGAAIAELPRTLLHNFGGWYNGEEKVTTVSGDVTLTAKWFDKADVTMDGETDARDIVRSKKALAADEDDLLYDVDRDNAFAATDVTVLRNTLLGNEVITVVGNDIATYTVESGAQASFMTARATESLVETLEGYSDNSTKTSSDKKIVVGISNIEVSVLKTAALENLIGIDGDVYGLNDYKIFLKDGNIYIEAGSDYATAFAVNKFIDFIKKYKMVPAGFELSGKYNGEKDILNGYSLVWGDEFDGDTLNAEYWNAELVTKDGPAYNDEQMKSIFGVTDYQLNIGKLSNEITVGNKTFIRKDFDEAEDKVWNLWCLGTTTDNGDGSLVVSDGLLTMNSIATEAGFTGADITAKHNFKYGIMEARIMLGSRDGAAATFWARSKDKAADIPVNEFDFVENYGSEKIVANLHTWENAGKTHINHNLNKVVLPSDGEKFSDTFHHIAFVWTSDKVTFYLDGVAYLEQDITDGEWDAFREETFLRLGVTVPNGEYIQYYDQDAVTDYADYNVSQKVDYIRIYQTNKNFTLN